MLTSNGSFMAVAKTGDNEHITSLCTLNSRPSQTSVMSEYWPERRRPARSRPKGWAIAREGANPAAIKLPRFHALSKDTTVQAGTSEGGRGVKGGCQSEMRDGMEFET